MSYLFSNILQTRGPAHMSKRPKTRETMAQMLASCSDSLFPAEMGEAPVALDSCDVVGDTPLHVMLWRDNTYAILRFIEAGADVNAVGDMSETPLHVAVRKQNATVIEAMLNAGASTPAVSEFGKSPKEMADVLGGDIQRMFAK